MSRFLVTGGAGFIGSHIAAYLVKKGHFVRVMDNFSSGKKENLAGLLQDIDLFKADIRSERACLKATRGIDFVLHQAALRSVPKSMLYPQEYNEVNITGTVNLLEASLKNKVKSFVFASSSSVYGETSIFPEKEDFLVQPVSPYALTKLAGEHYCRMFSYQYGLPTVSLRYFNVFGPRQSLDDEYAVVIPKFIHCIINDQPPPIFGTGRQSRDFTYVDNVVQANILAARRLKSRGEVYNVATGSSCTIRELADKLNKILGKKIKPVFLKPRPGDVFKTLADLSRIKRILGFRPGVKLEAGLRLTCAYFQGIWQN
jgi:nucleoside-diphosphate-sugar epimerase